MPKFPVVALKSRVVAALRLLGIEVIPETEHISIRRSNR